MIEGKIVNGPDTALVVDAVGVVIRDSVVNGGVYTDFGHGATEAENDTHPRVFTIESSRIYSGTTGSNNRALGYAHYKVTNSLIQGAQSGAWAHNKVVLVGNYITTDGTSSHQSGMRMLKNSTLRGNTLFCKPSGSDADGNCSGDTVFYREFGVPVNLTIDGNYFRSTKSESGQGQWFATRFVDCYRTDDCVNIKATGNLFDRGQGTDGGEFPNDAGDVWSGNYWTDGVPALSGQSR